MKDPRIVRLFGDRRVSTVWQSLFANPRLTVKQLANTVGLSESRLEHLIAEYAGVTIRELKRRLRIERLQEARRQLLDTTDTILAIRERAGYAHDSNFIHDFKKLFGVTPASCRREEK